VSALASHILNLHGLAAYALVGGICFSESAFIIAFFFPGETALVFGGVLASEHHVSIAVMVAVAIASTTLGYFVGYTVGRAIGPRLLGAGYLARRPGVERTRATIAQRGATAVFVARFIPFVRAFMPGVAGASGVDLGVFSRANIAGGVIWGSGYTLAGFAAGEAYRRFVKDASTAAEIVAGVIIVAFVIHRIRSRRTNREGWGESRPRRSTIAGGAAIVPSTQTSLNDEEQHMSLQLGDVVPDFTADSTDGTINFHEYLGDGWGVLFSHPRDFTPVCTTELGEVSRLKDEFDKRNVKVVGLSVDPVDSHKGWVSDIKDATGQDLNFPLLGDPDHKVADLYGMIHPNASDTMTVRSVFVIGPDKKLKLEITYPASTGRNFQEILRVIDSLQLTAKYSVATPVNWKDGEDVIITTAVSDEDAKTKFPKGFTAVKPYLRYTPQPNR
jgi:alkyl hydroperoxide reductase subunit AhpC/membrane protein DedA with SNARE-associated domain